MKKGTRVTQVGNLRHKKQSTAPAAARQHSPRATCATCADEAEAIFRQTFNCCQAVIAAYAEQHGLDRDTALKLATGFGGGVSHMGKMCGAVTGAVMVLGLRHGRCRVEDVAAKQKTMDMVRQFARRFRQRHGALDCRQLLGCDLNKPEEFEWAKKQGLFATRCPKLVRDAVAILEELH